MNLEQALKEKNKIFPMPRNGFSLAVAEERAKYICIIRRLYDMGYRLTRKK